MTKLFILIIFLSTTSAFARPSSLKVSSNTGSGDYTSLGLLGKLGIDPQWQLEGQIYRNSRGSDITKGARAGANMNLNSHWNIGLLLQASSEPQEVSSKGLAPSFTFNLSSLWQAERLTELNVILEWNRYQQKSSAINRSLPNSFQQRAIHGELSQEITDSLEGSIFLSSYTYSAGGSTISRTVNRRSAAMPHSSAMVAGFPKNSFGLGFDWDATELISLSVNASRSGVMDSAAKTNSFGAGAGFNLNGPTIQLNYSRSSTTGFSDQHYYGLGLGYSL